MLEIVKIGEYTIDFSRQKILKGADVVNLSKKISGASAWKFLELLINANGCILTYAVLDDSVIWRDDGGKGVDHRSSIKTWVSEFNKVLGSKQIKNKSGVGYYFDGTVVDNPSNNMKDKEASVDTITANDQDECSVFLQRVQTNELILLLEGVTLFGKDRIKCAYCILDNPLISRIHAAIYKSSTMRITVQDMNSANGTYINDRRIPPMIEFPVNEQDVVRLADEEFAVCYIKKDENKNKNRALR